MPFLSPEALNQELERTRRRRQECIVSREFVHASVLTLEIEFLEAQQSLLAAEERQLPEAMNCLEESRLEAHECLLPGSDPEASRALLIDLPVSKLKSLLKDFGLSAAGCLEKTDFIECLGWRAKVGSKIQSESIPKTMRAAQEANLNEASYQAAGESARTRGVGAECAWSTGPANASASASSPANQSYWNAQLSVCADRAQMHAKQGPRTRRAYSWARSLAYARCMLGASGSYPLRRGCEDSPFVVWVYGCTNEVEVDLAETGFFDDANWVDWAPMEIVLFGEDLRVMEVMEPKALEHRPPVVSTDNYANIEARLKAKDIPDFVATFMPYPVDGVDRGLPLVPAQALHNIPSTPVVVFTRTEPGHGVCPEIFHEFTQELLVPVFRFNPSNKGSAGMRFVDNGWCFAVIGGNTADKALSMLERGRRKASQSEQLREEPILPALFWGIVDLKFDPSRPVLERVKVLETGDGRTSKFSHDGAEIQKKLKRTYRVRGGGGPQKYTVISTDKCLTHDLMEETGYGHLVPKQVCFPRVPNPNLPQKIIEGLEIKDPSEATIVLKLCNRSRGAGVVMLPASDFSQVLSSLLEPPQDLGSRAQEFAQQLSGSHATDLGLERGQMEEHSRHWWSNEGPSFVAERFCTSAPVIRNNQAYDGTMRVSFVLRQRAGASGIENGGVFAPEDFDIDWLGGYWKLPNSSMGSSDLRERSVSAARASGTAPVALEMLHEVYAALGDSMQQLFGGPMPSEEHLVKKYTDQPALAAYLIARLALSSVKVPMKVKAKLEYAQSVVREAAEDESRRAAESFIHRGMGVLEIRPGGARSASEDQWATAASHFAKSVQRLPLNANALFWYGMAMLETGKVTDAIELMNRSLFLDPDFKGPYVNLGAAYIRARMWTQAIEISNACLARYPQSPQCNYHLGVAAYQDASDMYEAGEDTESLLSVALDVSLDGFQAARQSDEGLKRKAAMERAGRPESESPWLPEDSKMFSEAESLKGTKSPAPLRIALPDRVGWGFMHWRT